MNFITAYHSEKGINKPTNQDGLLIKTANTSRGKVGLFVVCDGMGGLRKGELASATVIRGLSDWFTNQLPNHIQYEAASDDIWVSFETKVNQLNAKIAEYGELNNIQLGTTLTAMLVLDDDYYIAQVGDSRLYRILDNVVQVTEDQSLVAREVSRGVLTAEEARNHPKRHVLLQCIGVRPDVELVKSKGHLDKNDSFLLCTDGFYQKITEEELQLYFVEQKMTSRECGINALQQLTNRAIQRGETDDISALYITVI